MSLISVFEVWWSCKGSEYLAILKHFPDQISLLVIFYVTWYHFLLKHVLNVCWTYSVGLG